MFANLLALFAASLALFVNFHYFVRYFQQPSLRRIPGPLVAKFSSLWLLLQARRGHKYKVVDAAHHRWGPLVRIQPHHVSVADPNAVNAIYGHGNGFLKR